MTAGESRAPRASPGCTRCRSPPERGRSRASRRSRRPLRGGRTRLRLVRLFRLVRLLHFLVGRRLGQADPALLQQLRPQLAEQILVLEEIGLRRLAAVAQALAAVGDPGAALLQEARLDAEVDDLPRARDPLAVADVELRLPERRR